MKLQSIFFVLSLSILLTFISCKKDTKTPEPPVSPSYSVPSAYNFNVVNYSEQTTRMAMLDEMVTYMKTAQTPNTIISAATLKNMFSNSGSLFTDPALNTSGKQLENQFYSSDLSIIKSFMDSIAAASSNSINIVTSSTYPSRKYVLNANGFDYTEMIEKLSMGAIFYYQAMETYISSAGVGNTVDNTNSVAGEGTAMEHHWDEGFGYLGVPQSFPTNTTGIIFWGEYLDAVGSTLGNKKTLMSAFIKGRAAISNKDYATRDEQINIITSEWEKLIAASAIHELNESKVNLADNAIRNHVLSEARGFIMCLKYKTAKIMTQTKIDTCLSILGSSNNTITLTAINQVIDELATAYNMQTIKNSL